jgi:hypothetical protein
MLITAEQTKFCIICGGLDTSSFYCKACEEKDWPEPSPVLTDDPVVKLPKLHPLARSAAAGKWKEVESLLAQKADPFTMDHQEGMPVIYRAVIAGNESIVKAFIEKAPRSVVYANPSFKGTNCLHIACDKGHLKVTEKLPFPFPEFPDLSAHSSPISPRYPQIVEMLLRVYDDDALLVPTGSLGCTCLDLAARHAHSSLPKFGHASRQPFTGTPHSRYFHG